MAAGRSVLTGRALAVAAVVGAVSAAGLAFRTILREGSSGRTFTGLSDGDPAVLRSLATNFVLGFVLCLVLIAFGILKIDAPLGSGRSGSNREPPGD